MKLGYTQSVNKVRSMVIEIPKGLKKRDLLYVCSVFLVLPVCFTVLFTQGNL